MAERVYRNIKSRILSCELIPGDRLDVELLSEDVHASATPIREALNRLIGERLVVPGAKKGFIVPIPTEDGVQGLYQLNEILLDASVKAAIADDIAGPNSLGAEKIFRIESQRSFHGLICVQLTRHLFAQIAARSMPGQVVDAVENVSDRLSYVRLLECDFIDEAEVRLKELLESYTTARYDELQSNLLAYHDQRRSVVRRLLGDGLTLALAKKLKASM